MKINLKESLIKMDIDTDFEYSLTSLYESLELSEKKKKDLVKYISSYDIDATNRFLSNEAMGQGLMENACDDIPDEEMDEAILEAAEVPEINPKFVSLGMEIEDAANKHVFSKYGEEDASYVFVDVVPQDNGVKIEVRTELGYEGNEALADVLNPIVADYDESAYFDMETAGIMNAYVREDFSDDIPDMDVVDKWADKFFYCSNRDECRKAYAEYREESDANSYNTGTDTTVHKYLMKAWEKLPNDELDEDINKDGLSTNAQGDTLIAAEDGKSYSVCDKNGKCKTTFEAKDEKEAIDKFTSNKMNEATVVSATTYGEEDTYENDDWNDFDEVEPGYQFFEDGKDWTVIKKVMGPIAEDFNNWSVFLCGTPEDADDEDSAMEGAWFVMDEDTGFVDWGPCDSEAEAVEFLESKADELEEGVCGSKKSVKESYAIFEEYLDKGRQSLNESTEPKVLGAKGKTLNEDSQSDEVLSTYDVGDSTKSQIRKSKNNISKSKVTRTINEVVSEFLSSVEECVEDEDCIDMELEYPEFIYQNDEYHDKLWSKIEYGLDAMNIKFRVDSHESPSYESDDPFELYHYTHMILQRYSSVDDDIDESTEMYCVNKSSPDGCYTEFKGTKEECANYVEEQEGKHPSFVRYTIQPENESAKWSRDFDVEWSTLKEANQLNEGPGASYSIYAEGYKLQGNIISIDAINVVEDDGNYKEYGISFTTDFKGVLETFKAENYDSFVDEHGLDIEAKGPMTIYSPDDSLRDYGVIGDGEVTKDSINVEALTTFVLDILSGAKCNFIIGGGWSHSKYDGRVSDDDYALGNVHQISTELVTRDIYLSNEEDIKWIDGELTQDNYEYEYLVLDEDENEVFATDDEQEALSHYDLGDGKYSVYEIVYHIELNGEANVENQTQIK